MSMQTNPYADIMQLKRPESNRAHMAVIDRAAQFLPFAALTGYEEAIAEAGRLTQERREEDEGQRAVLDEKLRIIIERMSERPEVKITWFEQDEYKDGGAYRTIDGVIKKIDDYKRTILMEEGVEIEIDSIVDIDSTVIEDLFGYLE